MGLGTGHENLSRALGFGVTGTTERHGKDTELVRGLTATLWFNFVITDYVTCLALFRLGIF